MAGKFTSAFYESSDVAGRTFAIRVQPETLTLTVGGVANVGVAGPATESIGILVGGSQRRRGAHSRKVRVAFTGAVPDGYSPSSILSLPVLNIALWEQLNTAPDQTGTITIAGAALGIKVVGLTPERARQL
jgi:hypothetical protein